MNHFIEEHDKLTARELMRLVNDKLSIRADENHRLVVPLLTINDARMYSEQGLGVETVVEEHLSYWNFHG